MTDGMKIWWVAAESEKGGERAATQPSYRRSGVRIDTIEGIRETRAWATSLLAGTAGLGATAAAQEAKKPVASIAGLSRHSYPFHDAAALLTSRAAIEAFAMRVEADTRATLADKPIDRLTNGDLPLVAARARSSAVPGTPTYAAVFGKRSRSRSGVRQQGR